MWRIYTYNDFICHQEFKVFLCFTLFVAATSGATVCKCGPEEKDVVPKYTVEVDDGNEQYDDEEIEVDTEKQTETFHISNTGFSSAGNVDVIYDFNQNLAMYRSSSAKACFLGNSTEELPKPDDLMKILDKGTFQDPLQAKTSSEYLYEVVGTLDDRSNLSDEMAAMCAKLPIYRMEEKTLILDVEKENLKRVKRQQTSRRRWCRKVVRSPPCQKVIRRGNRVIIIVPPGCTISIRVTYVPC